MQETRINLGCGTCVVKGWVNIDRSPGPLLDRFRIVKRLLYKAGAISDEHMVVWPRGIVRADARKGLRFPSGSADAVYSSHMLEHIYFEEAKRVLLEVRRVLRQGGVVRLALPDGAVLAQQLIGASAAHSAQAALEYNIQLRAHPLARPTARGRLAAALGANIHLWQPTRALVLEMLVDAGFRDVQERRFREGDLPDLVLVEDREESFFLEGIAP